MKVLLIAGARPNFMKIAPVFREAQRFEGVRCQIVHTGQHYDYQMSQAFFEGLGLPEPHFYLAAGSGSHAVQTAKIMVAFEEVCEAERPDLVMVVGDVNSTLACSIVAKKLMIEVAHVEAGLRSFDLAMPEEINRMVTDAIADHLFVTEKSGVVNLLREGKSEERIHFVGNVMIDNLFHQLKLVDGNEHFRIPTDLHRLKEEKPGFIFLTLHRPSNVDTGEKLSEIVVALNHIAEERRIFFPIHPRTEKMMKLHEVNISTNIIPLPPLGFAESLLLWKDAALVMTDSGGLQEETTALGVPCITLRENTERPVTIEMGTNVLGGTGKDSILAAYEGFKTRDYTRCRVPPLWDGRAAARIWEVLIRR